MRALGGWPALHVPVNRKGGVKAHPTAVAARANRNTAAPNAGQERPELDATWLHEICLDAGADDVGFAALSAPGLEGERDYVLEALPGTRSLIAFCVRQSRDNVRSRATSLGTADAATTSEMVGEVARSICLILQERGIRAMYPAAKFPREVHRFPARSWTVSHKLAAVAAGLGHLGLHNRLIHPRFGSFVALGTVLVQALVRPYSEPLALNPCLGCDLCVITCPVGAINPDGAFDAAACGTHNYPRHLANFAAWVEEVADSTDARDYRTRVTQSETILMWQDLSFGPRHNCEQCVAVCPAGEDVIGPYLNGPDQYVADIVEPLRAKPEPVYVSARSNSDVYVRQHFPHKTPRYVRASSRPPEDIDPAPRAADNNSIDNREPQ